jgi:alpha-L-fucosidase 2
VLPTNLLNSGESLVVMLERQMRGLIDNVAPRLRNDSAAIYSQVGWDLRSQAGQEISPPNELGDLTWVSHNMWLQYRYSMDRGVLSRVGWDLLRRTANFHAHFAGASDPSRTLRDGRLHTPLCGSPECPRPPGAVERP